MVLTKVVSGNKVLTKEETEQEKQKDTPLGRSLKRADEEYKKHSGR